MDPKKRLRKVLPISLAVVAILCVAGFAAVSIIKVNDEEKANKNSDEYTYVNLGYKVPLSDDYRDKVTLLSSDELDDNAIIAVYQTATIEKYPEMGFLFRIVRHTPAEFEQYWPAIDVVGGSHHFARDGDYYYSIETPTDVQADAATPGVLEEWEALAEQKDTIISRFMERNHLTAYDHEAAVYHPQYTYPGVHAIFLVTLSNGAKFKVVLSKPVRQGDDGIWCVERMYDENENLYIAMPKTELTAMEYYKQLQKEADGGQRRDWLNAEEVGLKYLAEVWDYARHIKETNIEYINE